MSEMTLQQDAITTTFQDVEKLLHSTCHNFQKKYGGNYEDHFSLSQEIFLEAYDQYDHEKGMRFSTFVRQLVWWRLQDETRHQGQRQSILPRERMDEGLAGESPTPFDLGDFCEVVGLSGDAKKVVHLVVTRKEVPDMIRSGKAALRKILTKEFSWTDTRIKSTFKEITTALEEAQA